MAERKELLEMISLLRMQLLITNEALTMIVTEHMDFSKLKTNNNNLIDSALKMLELEI
jgi:hypothetical protein